MSTQSYSFDGARPILSGEAKTYFDFCQDELLMLQWCAACERTVFYPRSACPYCLGADLAWRAAAGTGSVHTYSIHYRGKFGPLDEPYIVAVVDLEEGVRLLSRVICDLQEIAVGLSVRVAFAHISPDFKVPVFVPQTGGEILEAGPFVDAE